MIQNEHKKILTPYDVQIDTLKTQANNLNKQVNKLNKQLKKINFELKNLLKCLRNEKLLQLMRN